MELYFLKMKIRFIAICDNLDSDVEGSSDFAPLRNWMNEFHPKETSKKVRDVKNAQGRAW